MHLADLYTPASGWKRTRIDAVAATVRQTIYPSDLGHRRVLHISIPAVDELGQGRVEAANEIGSQKLELHGGEVLISRLNPRKSRVVLVGESTTPILASGEFIPLIPGPDCDRRFLTWLLRSQVIREWLDSNVQSVTRSHQRVDPEALTQQQIWMPSLDEQRCIAHFLDVEIAKIDQLTRLKRELVFRLPERVRAVMHNAIAAQPRNARLAYIVEWRSGGTPPKDDEAHWTGDLPWASTKDLGSDELRDTIDHVTEDAAVAYSSVVPQDTLLVATRGMALAKRLPLAITRRRMAFNQDLKGLVPLPGLEADYLRIVLRGFETEVLTNVVESAHGTRRLETRHLKSLKVPVPGLEAQRAVVEEVQVIEEQNHAVAAAIERQIDLLAERRDALITAAVTGRLDPSSYHAPAIPA